MQEVFGQGGVSVGDFLCSGARLRREILGKTGVSDGLALALFGYGRRSAGRQKATRHDAGAGVGGVLHAKDPAWGAYRVLERTSQ
jgi:hypothetical protein